MKKELFEIELNKVCLFVTWTMNDNLCGCIGTFEPENLRTQLEVFSLKSAIEDTRFTPITKNSINNILCSVSILGMFENAENGWDDWEIGKHGIIINYKQYSATFLPSVCVEQKWNKMQTVISLLRKAGYNKSISTKVLQNLSVKKYQCIKYEASYLDYLNFMKKKDETLSLGNQ